MSAVLEWLKTFLMLYFFLTLILYLVPKKSYQKYLQFAVKMILLVVVFLPLLNRVSSGVDFFSLVEEFETYKAESGLTDMEGLEGLQNGYVEERSGYYQEHYGESESSFDPRTFGGSGTCACDTDRKKDRIENGF